MNQKNIMSTNSLIVACLIVLLISITYGIAIKGIFGDWISSGSFGDTYGALNTIFSGLAFAGIIYTILLQKMQLEMQLEELQHTREEMKLPAILSKEEVGLLIESAPILKHQVFLTV